MAKKLSQLTAISSVGNIPANIIFGISNTASGTSNTISLLSLTTHLDSTFATDIASLANVGAGLITVTSAYQANTGAAALAGQANVGAARIADVSSGQANTGAGLIIVGSRANSAFEQSNLAYVQANAGFNQANTNYLPAVTRLNVTNSGSSAFLLYQYSGNNPAIYVRAGETLAFNLSVTGHPFLIRVSNAGANSDTGLTHVTSNGVITTSSDAQGKQSGTLYWKVPYNLAGNTYVYQCSVHSGMVGNIIIEPSVYVAYNQANIAFNAANSAVTTGQANVGASVIILTNNISNAFNQANSAYTAANTALNITQNIQIQDYTLQLTDRGKHIYSSNTQVQTITIPNAGVVAWPTGTVIDIVLDGTGKINVATSNDVTLYVANNSTVRGYANVYPRGWATLLYVSGNTWYIKGQGVD